MGSGQIHDASERPRRRGRPSGSHKKTVVMEHGEVVLSDTDVTAFNDEQLAYLMEEEKLTPFSSLLRHILRRDRVEIARVAKELEVTENTVYRWMNGSSEPRLVHLKRLPEVLSEHRNNLVYSINQTFHGVLDPPRSGVREVRKDIYRRVMELLTTTEEDDARYWQITQAVFEYALFHLDIDRHGIAITYASIMPPHDDGIYSLRELAMRGNHPWPFSLESRAYLGSTTLAGTAAMTQRMQIWNKYEQTMRLQVAVDEFERSACAYPVMRANCIAGVLVVSSALPTFFSEPLACQAVAEYAQLLSLGLIEKDFYPVSSLNLKPMPDLKWQREDILRVFANRIIACAHKYKLSWQDAELQVIREMELEYEALGHDFALQEPDNVEYPQEM